MLKLIAFLLISFISLSCGQTKETIEVGSFNIEWFPCKDDGEMMKNKYDIDLITTIFIDDPQDNCNSAINVGIKSIQNTDPNETISKLDTLINPKI